MNLTVFIPEIVLFGAGLLIALWPLSRRKTLIISTAPLILLAASLFGLPPCELFTQNYVWDDLGLYISLLILLSAALACFLAYYQQRPDSISFRKFVMWIFALSGLLIFLAGVQNLLFFLVIWSLAQILFYFFLREFDRALAWNYLALDLVSTLVLTLGVALLFAISGNLNLIDIKTSLVVEFFTRGSPGKVLHLGFILITIGLISKLGLFPFYFNLAGLPRSKSLLPCTVFSLLLRLGLVAFAIRFWLRCAIIYPDDWQFILLSASILSALWGAFGLLVWKEKKEWLYLDLIQMGFLAGPVSAAAFTPLSGGLFFLGSYILGFWGLILIYAYLNYTGFDFSGALKNLRSDRLIFWALVICLGSLVGLPATLGFWGKYSIFSTLEEAKMPFLAYSGLLANLILAIYFGHLFIRSLLTQPVTITSSSHPALRVLGIICALALLALGLFPDFVLTLALEAAGSIPF
ncbi:MAG: hypothetical protein A2Z27_02805 [candidate division Zixibacteria bacterium RBG_16_50_21]|nr:MAG: hypothetical protein A2Z27_02805 [candidate division Zixibacteria bacterium RBG_16_50_21]